MKGFLKILTTALLISVSFNNSFAQSLQTIVDSLKRSGVDTFIVYSDHSGSQIAVAYIAPKNVSEKEKQKYPCVDIDPIYVFYKQNNNTLVQKINKCITSKPILVGSTIELDFFLTQSTKIAGEKILPYVFVSDGDTLFTMASHERTSEMYLSAGATKKNIRFAWRAFSPGNSSSVNINYENNINSKTRELVLLIDERIKQLDFVSE